MYNVMLITLLIVTSLMIAIILFQKVDGNNSVLGSSGGSGGMFSARGTANLLTRITSVLATVFLSLCVLMMWHSAHYSTKPQKLFEQAPSKTESKETETKKN